MLNTGLQSPMASSATSLTQSQIVAGLKEALTIAATNVTQNLGQTGGFLNKTDIRIPLPQSLQNIKSGLQMAGLGSYADEVETKMNRAAEASMPLAKESFIKAVQSMSIQDAMGILNGGNTAATDYFKQKMTPDLTTKITPIVQTKLNEAGALQAYNGLVSQAQSLPMVSMLAPNLGQNLTTYAVDKTLAGAFTYMGKEEAAIRTNPAARTTDLLKQVFGTK